MEDPLRLLKLISSPFSDSKGGNFSNPDNILDKVTTECRETLTLCPTCQNVMDNCGPVTPAWAFTVSALNVLLKLKEEVEGMEAGQTEEESSIDVLSIQAKLDILKVTELIVGFAVVPFLLPNVGVPDKVRKKNVVAMELFLSEDVRQPPFVKFHRLAQVLEVMLDICSHPSFGTVIIPKHVSDLLSGLLQVCKAPIAKPSPKPGTLTDQEYAYILTLRERFQIHLSNLLISVPKPLLINVVFLIGEKPKFMRDACLDIMNDILLSKNGLLWISTTLLSESSSSDVWNLAKVISNLMRRAIRDSSNLEIVTEISAQCVKMISGSQPSDNNDHSSSSWKPVEPEPLVKVKVSKELRRIGLFCALVLMDINQQISTRLVWDHVFRPVLALRVESVSNQIGSDISDIINASEVAEELLSLVPPTGISIPLLSFQPLWTLFLQVLCTCRKYATRKVQDPEVSRLSHILSAKLEALFVLLFEVVGLGAGTELKTDASDAKAKTTANYCTFCLQLLFNGTTDLIKLKLLTIGEGEEGENESIKIVRTCRKEEEGKDEEHDSTSVLPESESLEEHDAYFFEVLADECEALGSVLKVERLYTHASALLRQLLNYEREYKQENMNENSLKRNEKGSSINLIKDKDSLVQPCSNELITLQEQSSDASTKLKKFAILKLLEEVGGDEKTVENCVNSEDYKETLSLVKLVMQKLAHELEESALEGDHYEFSQTIVFSLGFLGTIVETASSSLSEQELEFWDALQQFVPSLLIMSHSKNPSLVNCGVPTMAKNILTSIETRGKAGVGKDEKISVVQTQVEKALEDVSNPMVPIKGHGLLQLRKLIEAKDPEALKRDKSLLQIFKSDLRHEDSYIYLMAIQGLAALGLKFHKIVLPIIIHEYGLIEEDDEDDDQPRKGMTDKEKVECRMKIGEVLVKVVRGLGEIAPVYRVPLTNAFFSLGRDNEPLIRASALSNLGELCQILRFSLGSVLTEVWHNVEAVLNCEKDVHVRRAALHLLVLLLKGVEKEIPNDYLLTNVELGTYLRDSRQLLSRVERQEEDPVARTHAQLALQELSLIAKKILLPKQEISYKISLLN